MLISLSSGAILGGLFLIIIAFVDNKKSFISIALILIILISGLYYFNIGPSQNVFDRVYRRISTVGQSDDDNLAGRGYDRFIVHPEYVFLGAGERPGRDFDVTLGSEFHSGWGVILFSYGLPGFFMVALFFIFIFQEVGLKSFSYLIPTAFYGLTHQHLRFTLFWLLIAFILTTKIDINEVK
ncbi:hypothetical protein LJ207_10065 [Halanaerobium sp. Z-7514]|uniref:O-antigen polymerase n=1 Tax=Halanaerobium polyolivorans TaxID=2886943 RepID=A0AAW4X1J1_9FIRM|nr:hypothetical protein [Halanaerobium polyolivorans]MCC3145667.1 hypothetical protein [Halanaerobium polyolivorans]